MSSTQLLDQYLTTWAQGDSAREEIRLVITGISDAGIKLSKVIAAYDPTDQVQAGGELNAGDQINADGEVQNPLGLLCHKIFESALRDLPVSFMASEECADLLSIDPRARYAVAIDTLDGSSNVETNMAIGAIFSILETSADDLYDIDLGDRQKAAGFICFGPQTRLVLSCGEGTIVFLLDPAAEKFHRVGQPIQIPLGKREFAINTSNYRFWDPSVRHFIDDCIAGEDGALGEDFNMRWNAALVAEAFRILMRGGVFLYPGDTRPDYQNGRLPLLYKALPIAMLIEQAGGAASNGNQRILEMKLSSLNERVPLIFGSQDRVREVIDYISGEALNSGQFPLFVNRSLLRN